MSASTLRPTFEGRNKSNIQKIILTLGPQFWNQGETSCGAVLFRFRIYRHLGTLSSPHHRRKCHFLGTHMKIWLATRIYRSTRIRGALSHACACLFVTSVSQIIASVTCYNSSIYLKHIKTNTKIIGFGKLESAGKSIRRGSIDGTCKEQKKKVNTYGTYIRKRQTMNRDDSNTDVE